MEVIKGDAIKSEESSVVVALGTFDGIHYGHQKIIDKTINSANKFGCESALFSFTPHPLQVVAPKQAPRLITSWKQKCRILSQLGLDKLYLEEFSFKFSKLNFERFVKNYLVNDINAQKVIVGQDFKFGYKGLGDTRKLRKLGEKYGFEVEVLEPVTIEGQVVSSTHIRELIRSGRVGKVKTYLTRNYFLVGQVVNGDKRGRKLGFPTANLKPTVNYVIPKSGVYATYVYINEEQLIGVVHLGTRPTFDKDEFTIEVHIFDFAGDIYQQEIEVEFVERLRDELSFANQKDLINQIKLDITRAKNILLEN